MCKKKKRKRPPGIQDRRIGVMIVFFDFKLYIIEILRGTESPSQKSVQKIKLSVDGARHDFCCSIGVLLLVKIIGARCMMG